MKPSIHREDALNLWHLLRGRGWQMRREIPMNARKIRAVCSEYPEHFLSTQKGYKVVREATNDEIEEAIADLRSRIRHMSRRADALDGVLFARRNNDLAL